MNSALFDRRTGNSASDGHLFENVDLTARRRKMEAMPRPPATRSPHDAEARSARAARLRAGYAGTVARCVRLLEAGALSASLLFGGCATDDAVGEFYTDWDRAGACTGPDAGPWGTSLDGKTLGPCMFAGRFVWITYDALWCSSCERQTRASRDAAAGGAADTVFVTVVTGGRKMLQPAGSEELRAWVERHGLDPARVVSEGATSRSLPQHMLIGPDGRTWLRYVGMLGADRILATIDAFRRGERQPPQFGQ